MENFTLNENLKRLEPVHKRCAYCGMNDFSDMADNYFVPVYRKTDSTNLILYQSVKYRKLTLGIPRCAGCKRIHRKVRAITIITAILVFLIIMGGCIWLWEVLGFFIGLFGGGFAAGLTSAFLSRSIAKKYGIPDDDDGAKNSESVRELLNAGWSLIEPSPGD